MKTIKLVILFILLVKITHSQKNITYHYVLNEHIAAADSVPLFGMEQEFITERKYYAPLIFSETRLFTGNNKKSILYKIENGVWYYKLKKKWKLFYDYNKMVGGNILLFGLNYKIQFKKAVNIRNITLHKIILEPIGVFQSHSLEYYFCLSKGIVIIQSSNAILLRSDSFEHSLTDDEIDIL